MTEPTWTLPQIEVLLEGYRTRLSDEALAWLRKLKDQRERLREALEGVFVGRLAVADVEHLLKETE